MPYKYLNDIATADIAFCAWGKDLSVMFASACDATLNILVEDITSVESKESKGCEIAADNLELLLYSLLEKIVFFKDAENLFLKMFKVSINQERNQYVLRAEFMGEKIDTQKHPLYLDIKAITFHQLSVRQEQGEWKSIVVVDV